MISAYFLRLACLSFASFFLVYLALSLLGLGAAPSVARLAGRRRPQAATRLLLGLRLLPLGLSLFVVLGLCLPSYLLFEPRESAERVGAACVLAALAGFLAWGVSIHRALRALRGSLDYQRHCRMSTARRMEREGEGLPVSVLEGEMPLLGLAGILRPRIVMSSAVLRSLDPEQLAMALRHERAHWSSRDNLKRLILLLAPDPVPFFRTFAGIDRRWARYAEWAADDRAVAGDPEHSLSLASALVRMARLGKAARPTELVVALAGDDDFAERIERLLRAADSPDERPRGHFRLWAAGAAIAAISLVLTLVLQPATFYSVHFLLERLIR